MKYMKRTGIYKATNVTFNPNTLDAFSYSWWRFVALVEGKVVFNSFRYSNTTVKHQRKVRDLMRELGINIDVELQLPRGIRHDQTLEELFVEAEETLCDQYLHEEAKRDDRNERARVRRAEKRAKADAELKANLDALSGDEILRMSAEIQALKAQGLSVEEIRESLKEVQGE